MAERAFETPQHFSRYVVLPNVDAFRAQSDSLQAAFNSITSIDALAGHLFIFCRDNGHTAQNRDGRFREELAQEDSSYRVIRDASNTYKHIELGNPVTLIKNANQTTVGQRPYGSGLYGIGSYGGEEVMIELDSSDVKHCLSEAILAHQFLISKLRFYGLL